MLEWEYAGSGSNSVDPHKLNSTNRMEGYFKSETLLPNEKSSRHKMIRGSVFLLSGVV